MISFPNAKINLGLNILNKRADGYHDLESCLYPVPFTDVLEIIPSREFSFANTGLKVDHDHGDNLCIKAYQLLKTRYGIPAVSMHLHKVIPMGAGLGGGSSDAAFTLKMLNDLFELGITNDQLKAFAAELGSDCPFFIDNEPALATGTGTNLTPISVDLKGKFMVLVFPKVSIGTAAAYAHVKPAKPSVELKEVLEFPVADWKDQVKNDFEASIFPNHPDLQKLKDSLYREGAIYAAMSGSGSTLFGIFDHKPALSIQKEGVVVKEVEL
ncbi:MAG: 4-(cytidine 5'-diphospho)-2-C-methyl-D-erythritol kinase [Cyclobacteriaceae bacterium]